LSTVKPAADIQKAALLDIPDTRTALTFFMASPAGKNLNGKPHSGLPECGFLKLSRPMLY
jgi:hypothetical protein